jgi:photosystem II stability/assembly factor-like uncharacterized protein
MNHTITMLLYYDDAGKAEMTTSTGAVYYTNNAGLNWKAQVQSYYVLSHIATHTVHILYTSEVCSA